MSESEPAPMKTKNLAKRRVKLGMHRLYEWQLKDLGRFGSARGKEEMLEGLQEALRYLQ